MKFLLATFLFCCSLSINAQQKEFLPVNSNSKLEAPVFSSTLAEIFEIPSITKSITIDVAELKNVGLYDFTQLESLELVQVKFTLAPDSSDAARKVFIDSVNVLLKSMNAFAKCPKLKKVVFCIGEQIYLKHTQTDEADAYENSKRKKLFEANVKGAWNAFGNDVAKLLPGVKLYAFIWGW